MKTYKIKQFTVGYLATNCYVVTNKDSYGAVIIDAGGGYTKIKRYLDDLDIRVVAVLCTHGHFDHVLDAYKWQKDGAKIYVHKDDVPFLTGERQLMPERIFAVTPTNPDKIVGDGDEIEIIGLKFKVIHTPGHSPGSVCYKLDSDMFVGDTIFFHSFGRTDFCGGDFAAINESIGRILSGSGDTILYTGHGENTTIAEEKLFNPLAGR